MSHLTKSALIKREGNYKLGRKHKVKKGPWFGEGEHLQPTRHTQGSGPNRLFYLIPPCSPQYPLASGKGGAWVKLRRPIHSSDR